MEATPVVPSVYSVSGGAANVYLIDHDGVTVVDTGVPGKADAILDAVRSIGRAPGDVCSILVTHLHPDHAGSLAALQRATGAATYMHPLDAALVRRGEGKRPLKPGPGLVNRVLYHVIIRNVPPSIEPAQVQHEVVDGDELPVAGGIRVVHLPGHSAGQVGFLWPHHDGVLFAGDVAAHVAMLGWSVAYEDLEVGRRSLQRLGRMEFEVACFGHGRPIKRGAAAAFRRRWPG